MSHHGERIAADLRSHLSRILALEVRDPRLEGAFVTGVRLSRDQSHLRIFYRTLGERGETERALEQAGGFIRKSLARGVSMRRVPELHFHFDDSIDRGQRIDEILRELDPNASDSRASLSRESSAPELANPEGEA